MLSKESLERRRCSELGVLGRAGRTLRAGARPHHPPSLESHPCNSLSSQETWHYSCEIKISHSTHSKLQLGEIPGLLPLGCGRVGRGRDLGRPSVVRTSQEDVLQWRAN